LMTSSRWARLVPAPSAETFCPLIRPW
jgi:hypothetical protein